LELARPIRIGNGVWIGGGAIILPGVTIGDGSVIGAGSVVPRDVPPGKVAAGNPARITRSLG
jgi:maltose O-acetyltransferase